MKSEKELFKIAEKIYFQYRESRYPKAIEAFKNLLNHYPNHIEGWSMLSTMQLCAENYEDAIDSIENAIKLDTNNISLWNQKQLFLHRINRFEIEGSTFYNPETDSEHTLKQFKNKTELQQEILSCCNIQISIVPKDYYNLGDLYEDKGRILKSLEEWDNAIEAFKSAIIFHEEYDDSDFINRIARCYFSIAKIHELQDNFLFAVEAYDKSFMIDNEEIILTHKARALRKMGDYLAAEKVETQFIEIATDQFNETKDLAYMYQIIDVYKETNQIDKAFETFYEMESKCKKEEDLEENLLAIKSELLQLRN